jgi:hypothetical protein
VLQVGGGGEALFRDRFGIGGEIGLAGGGGDTWVPLSINVSLHFPKSDRRNGLTPFVSGGYTRMAFFTEPGGINGFNVGVGLTRWLSDRTGLSLEFREVVYRALGTD